MVVPVRVVHDHQYGRWYLIAFDDAARDKPYDVYRFERMEEIEPMEETVEVEVFQRMAEIAVLRTHIVNYAKTREVYVAYRKAGYSKKFRDEHEQEILLHQAAKKAFDDMGIKKLPKVKELQAEYEKLLEEKKIKMAS